MPHESLFPVLLFLYNASVVGSVFAAACLGCTFTAGDTAMLQFGKLWTNSGMRVG